MRDVVALIQGLAESAGWIGDTLAEILLMIEQKDADEGLGALAVQVWSEALRNPEVGRRFAQLLTGLRADLTAVVSAHQASGLLPSGVTPSTIATLLISTVAGQILQTALLGPGLGADLPDAVRALWPK